LIKNFTINSPIRGLNLTARTLRIKGEIQEKKNDLTNALSCYTEGIEVKCKEDNLNARLYWMRYWIHQLLGEFKRLQYSFSV